jgi:hypothetical protein
VETLLRRQEDPDKFVELANGLHDVAVREVAQVWKGRVTKDGWMHGYGSPMDGRIVLHSQNDLSPLIEINCNASRDSPSTRVSTSSSTVNSLRTRSAYFSAVVMLEKTAWSKPRQ